MTLGRLATGIPIAAFTIFLIGCATPPRATAPATASDREVLTLNRFFDDQVAAETDPLLIASIEKLRTIALEQLPRAMNANVRHRFTLHVMQTTPADIAEIRTLINERRRCQQLQARLQQDTENIHEIVRTLSIAGCAKYIKLGNE